jgi:hypothetical protein
MHQRQRYYIVDFFGAVDFIGYTCDGENEEPHNCFVDVTYDLLSRMLAVSTSTLRTLTFPGCHDGPARRRL